MNKLPGFEFTGTKRLDTKKTAQFLDVSVRTLEDWRAKGKGPNWIKIGRKVRYELSELDRFIAAGTQHAGSAAK